MTNLERALWTKWIGRFGSSKVRELADGLKAGRSITEKSAAVVKSRTADELRSMLFQGFDGYFHQTVYLRKLAKPADSAAALAAIEVGTETSNSVTFETLDDDSSAGSRYLVMATRTIEFLPRGAGDVIAEDIPFPATVGIAKGILTIQVLTMQSGVETWAEIVGKELRRMLTIIQADGIYDQVLNSLRELQIDAGDYVDYSTAASKLLKDKAVDTYSGAFGVGTVGSTKHDTVRGKKRRPLRESMPKKFEELTSASRIIKAEAELRTDGFGLSAGSKVVLYPAVGKMAFRSNLQGCDPDEFVRALGKA